MEPFRFTIRYADFNSELLPVDRALLRDHPDMHRKGVEDFFMSRFSKMGGVATVVPHADSVDIAWTPSKFLNDQSVFEKALELLKEGSYEQAEPLLIALAGRPTCNPQVLLNYGMMLSDQGRLDEAVKYLAKATEKMPGVADAWNALGVACQRKGDKVKALESLHRSHAIEPGNPHTLRNLGGLLEESEPEQALEYLKQASALLPADQQAQYGYGLCLFKANRLEESDAVLRRVISLAPYNEIAELAKSLRTAIAHKNLKSGPSGDTRLDAVMYCLAALEKFAKSGPEARQSITFEIAMLGRSGLDINDSAQKYTLKSMPGKFSGLQLVSYMYVGMRQLAPEMDPGIDLSKEYEAAKQMHDRSVRD